MEKGEEIGAERAKRILSFFLRSSFRPRSSRRRRSPLTRALDPLWFKRRTARSLRSLVIASLVTVKEVMSSTR